MEIGAQPPSKRSLDSGSGLHWTDFFMQVLISRIGKGSARPMTFS